MQQLSLFDSQLQSKAERIRPQQRSPPPPPVAMPSTTTGPRLQLKTFPGPLRWTAHSAHRQCYLISIELFQMKCEGVSHSRFVLCPGAVCRLTFMIHVFPVWMFFVVVFFFCCRLDEPPPLSGCSPKRELLEKWKFSRLCQQLGAYRSPNYFVHRHFCCCSMLICWFWARWRVGLPAGLLPGKWK